MMHKSNVIISLACTAGLFLAQDAWPNAAAMVAAQATARVVEILSVTGEEPLNFGFVEPSPQDGTVTVSPDNARSVTGGVQATDEFGRAAFAVRGTPGHSYTIHAPPSVTFSAKEHNSDASESLARELTVTDFITYSVNTGTTAATGKLGQNGEDRIYLGGTLIVPANAAPGVYSGWVPLTVSY